MGNESKEFASRLRDVMTERGHISTQARSGIDIQALASAAGTSYEMARRYAEGVAIPRPGKLQAIANWLGVDAAALAYGANGDHSVNLEILEKCLEAIAEAQKRTHRTLSTERAAHLVALLYNEATTGGQPQQSAVDLLVKA